MVSICFSIRGEEAGGGGGGGGGREWTMHVGNLLKKQNITVSSYLS